MPIITLTSDFGADSPYVAQMKGAILCIAPQVTIVDITHSIPPQDVMGGAVVLADTAIQFPKRTIHVAVVDPGVGTDRGIVAAKVSGHWFIVPNNGLLTGVVQSGAIEAIHSVDNRKLWRAEVSNTFHGRDIMGPVAAHLAGGVRAEQIGPSPGVIFALPWPQPSVAGDRIAGEILAIDSFGNIITNITQTHLDNWQPAGQITVQCGGQKIFGIVRTYAERGPGELAALIGSSGRLEIAEVNGNAAQRLQVARGDAVRLSWSTASSGRPH